MSQNIEAAIERLQEAIDDPITPITTLVGTDDLKAVLALIDGQSAGGFPWENFPAYLIDKCEGDTISEEGIQAAASAMAKDPRYVKQPTKGEGVGNGQ